MKVMQSLDKILLLSLTFYWPTSLSIGIHLDARTNTEIECRTTPNIKFSTQRTPLDLGNGTRGLDFRNYDHMSQNFKNTAGQLTISELERR